VLAVNRAGHPANLIELYASLIGFNPRWLKVPKKRMSSHAMDLAVSATASPSSSNGDGEGVQVKW